MGLSITVIDDSDVVGTIAALVRSHELYMNNVKDMVSNVIAFAKGKKDEISRLTIIDHGNPKSFQIGSDLIASSLFHVGSA